MGDAGNKSIPHRLIEAAFACITEMGFAGTSVSQIAKAAGVDRSSFYHYFESKDDLVLNGCIRHILGVHADLPGAVVIDRFETDIWFLYRHVEEHATFYRSIDKDPFGKVFWNELMAELELRCFPIKAANARGAHAYNAPPGCSPICGYNISVMSVVFGFLRWWLPKIEHYESLTVFASAIRALRGIRAVHTPPQSPPAPSTMNQTRGWESSAPIIQTQPHG